MNDSLKFFFERVPKDPIVVEAGTRRWDHSPTHHKDLFPNAKLYTMVDCAAGEDVDVVVDLHSLSVDFTENSIDVFWASSVWEHLRRPWVAAEEVLRVLKPGGVFFLQTHQTFPVHGYPCDMFRFSKEALAELFHDATQVVTSYEFPCQIVPTPAIMVWNPHAPAYLNSCIAGVK